MNEPMEAGMRSINFLQKMFPYSKIWSLENIKFFYADDLNSLKRGGGRHAGWIILWWGCGAEVDIREYSGWPLKR